MVLVTNAIAILSEDRFLARVGWSSSAPAEPAFGSGAAGDASVKSKIINLIASVRTLMRSMLPPKSLRRTDYRSGQAMRETRTEETRPDDTLVPLIGINTLVILYLLALG